MRKLNRPCRGKKTIETADMARVVRTSTRMLAKWSTANIEDQSALLEKVAAYREHWMTTSLIILELPLLLR